MSYMSESRLASSAGGTLLSFEDTALQNLQQTYSLLSGITQTGQQTEENQPVVPSIFTEIAFFALVPVCIWCLASWAIAYADFIHLLAKLQLFAFLPAAATVFACKRIRKLRTLPSQMSFLKEENECYKASNSELKNGIELLQHEHAEAQAANRRLQESISGLESVRTAIQAYANKHDSDLGQVLVDFQRTISQQQEILQSTRRIQRRTKKLTEAQWRALMLNLYAQADRHDGVQGMSRTEFQMWLAMLPVEISAKLGPETFDEIDSDGNGIIDMAEMCNWVQTAVKTLLNGSSVFEVDGEATEDVVLDVSNSTSHGSARTAEKSVHEQWKAAGASVATPTAASGASSSRSSNAAAGGRVAQSPAPVATNRARAMMRSKAAERQESSMTRSPDTLANSVRSLSQASVEESKYTLSEASRQRGEDHSRPNSSRRSASVRPCFNESSLRTLFGGSGTAAPAAPPSGERATSTPPATLRYHPRDVSVK